MSLFSLIAVFLIEQLHPLDYRRVVVRPFGVWADFIESRFNAGAYLHGVTAWCLAVLPAIIAVGALYSFLYAIHPLLAGVLNVVVLYLTMGFRQFSHHYSEIQVALRLEDLPRARQLLGEWLGRPTADMSAGDVAQLSIKEALAASHRHVFAVLLWFVLLPGPCGALLYRFSAMIFERWKPQGVEGVDFYLFPRQIFAIIDWLPLRTTASAFAIVGDFEDAVYCWRTQPVQWSDREPGVVLAAGAGALGVQLVPPVVEGAEVANHAELGMGDPADTDSMQRAVGLVWRATVLWILLLCLLWLATLAG